MADDMITPDEWAPPLPEAPHDHKGHSEEKCLRCGWVMGHRPLNCMNDDTPHRFPSQQDEIGRLRQAIWDACAVLGMDTDGNATPRHLIHPPLDELIVSEARRARQDYDDLLEELEIQHG